MAKQLSEKHKKELLELKPSDITHTKFVELFADRTEKVDGKLKRVPSKIGISEEFYLEKGEYFNKEKTKTTAGQFIFNKFIIEEDFSGVLGYQTEINGKKVAQLEGQLSRALLNDEITVEQMSRYLDKFQWLSKQHHTIIAGSFTMNTLKPNPTVQKRRDELLKEYSKELEEGDIVTAVRIEEELVSMAYNSMREDNGLDMYDSGARGSFHNNHKNMVIMKGPVFNPTTGRYDIVESNFMEGIRKEELPVYGNAVVSGAYPKAIGTATSGYFSKQITAALQSVVLDSEDSDCQSKVTLEIVLTEANRADLLYRYIREGNKLTILDEEAMDARINKTIKLRSPMFCIGEKLCSRCAGKLYYLLNIKNIGLTGSRASGTMLNLSMKKFHDPTAKIHDVEVEDVVIS